MKHLFIVNPAAGKCDRTEEISAAVRSCFSGTREDWTVIRTAAPQHATVIAREAAESGDELHIYACGGDGTLHEVAGGAAGFSNAAVTQYPAGSGNDFIKIFGAGADLFSDLNLLCSGTVSEIDLMDFNGRTAINICSVGLDARIGLEMAGYKRLPFVSGKMAYRLSLVSNVAKGIHRPYDLMVDGESFSGSYTMICICNGRYYGNGFYAAPRAMPDDGLLEFLLIKAVSRLTVARVVGQFASGRAEQLPELITVRRGKHITIQCDRISKFNADGERLDGAQFSVSLSAKKLRFLHPAGTHW